jgi:hypothetical protein
MAERDMKLADHRLDEAVELFQGLPIPADPADKRRAQRVEIGVPVDIRIAEDSGSAWISAQMRDLSPRGVRLRVDRAIPADHSFLLRLPAKEGEKPAVPLICRVAYCASDNGCFIIGAEFNGFATTEESDCDSADHAEQIRRSILE